MNYRSGRSRACWRIVFALLGFSCAALSLPANAGVVTNTYDQGPGSLRQAIADAAPGETITFAAGVTGIITLYSGSLIITKELNIQGPGAALLTVSGNNASVNVFTLDAAPIVMSGLTIANGKVGIVSPRLYQTTLSNLVIAQNRDGGIEAPAGGINVSDSTITANGGSGIAVPNASIFSAFTVSVDRCTISYNHARSNGSYGGGLGGGIFVANGDAVVTNSTIAYNSSTSSPAGLDGDGGGILISDSGFIGNSGYAAISNCTIVNNSSDQGGGGIHLYDSQVDVTSCTIANNSSRDSNGAGITADTLSRVSLQNTIVARNNMNQNPSDIEAGFPVDGTSSYNLIGLGGSGGLVNGVNHNQVGVANPGLGSLGSNGGPTQTVPLTPSSPAIDAGNGFGLTTDQRGYVRPVDIPRIPNAGDGSDIGAFEAKSSPAPTRVVTNTNDSGPGSLRQAIADATPGETITFAAGVTGTITLTSGGLAVTKDLNIQGPGAALVTVSGNNSVIVFTIRASTVISGLTISNGIAGIVAPTTFGPMTLSSLVITQNSGPGIDTQSDITVSDTTITTNGVNGLAARGSASVTIDGSTISDNRALNGGGILLSGTTNASVTNSTIANNSATNQGPDGFGGGIYVASSAPATITNCTIVHNYANIGGGGIALLGPAFITGCTVANNSSGVYGGGIGGGGLRGSVLHSTIVARNQVNQNPSDIENGFHVDGTSSYNLIGLGGSGGLVNGVNHNQVGVANPGLGSLGDNGGPTQTVPLLPNSPAADAGNGFGLRTDQRGYVRPVDIPRIPNAGDGSDIGAFEAKSSPAGTPTPTPTATATFTPTPTATATFTPTPTPTATYTPTPTPTATATATFTPTPTATATFTPTPTATATFTPTPTATATFTPTPTATATATATFTPTPTATATATATFTPTPTPTPTPSTWVVGQWYQGPSGHYYSVQLITGSDNSWLGARAQARALVAPNGEPADLATLTSAEENDFVFEGIDDPAYWALDGGGNNEGPYLGGFQFDKLHEPAGDWAWVTGESWSYTNWASGEPNNTSGIEDFLSFKANGSARANTWNDISNAVNSVFHYYIAESTDEQACISPPADLISWWPGDGNANDIQGGNNGTLMNGATFAPGEVDQAFQFNGGSDRVFIADSPNLAITASLTLDAWINAASTPPNNIGDIIFRGDDRPFFDPYTLRMVGSNVVFQISDAVGNTASVQAPLPLNQFVHVSGTLDDATGIMTLYLNGIFAAQTTTTVRPYGTLTGANPGVSIGNLQSDTHLEPFVGLIDEVEVFNRALDWSEVLAIYNAGSFGKCKPATVSEIGANANIFGAGHATAPGGGSLPPVFNIQPGSNRVLTFSSVTGSVSYNGGGNFNDPDGIGSASDINVSSTGGISGIINTHAGFLTGVFVDNTEPMDPAPPVLDFSSIGTSFTSLSPALNQNFLYRGRPDGRRQWQRATIHGAGGGDPTVFGIRGCLRLPRLAWLLRR